MTRGKLLVTSLRITLILFWVPSSLSLPVYLGSRLKCPSSLVPCPQLFPGLFQQPSHSCVVSFHVCVEMQFSKTRLQCAGCLHHTDWSRGCYPTRLVSPLDWSCPFKKRLKVSAEAVSTDLSCKESGVLSSTSCPLPHLSTSCHWPITHPWQSW